MTRRRPRLRVLMPPLASPVAGRNPDLLPFRGIAPMHSAFVAHDIISNLADAGLGIAVIVEHGNLCLVAARPDQEP